MRMMFLCTMRKVFSGIMWTVMNVAGTGLNFITNEAKNLATSVIGISKRVVGTCFRYQYNAAVFPFIFTYGGIVYVFNWFNSNSENATISQPPNEVVIGQMRKLLRGGVNIMDKILQICPENENRSKDQNERNNEQQFDLPHTNAGATYSEQSSNRNVASMKMSEYSGRDLLWDIPVLSSKAKYFSQCVKEKKDDIVEARRALEQHPLETQIPDTRTDFNEMKIKAENKYGNLKPSVIKLNYADAGNADNCNANECTDSFEENYSQRKEFCFRDASSKFSPSRKNKCLYNKLPTQDKMCREISTVNKTLRKIQTTCSRLLGELSNLNEALTKVISMKEKLSNLEFQVDEGKRLLQEVECDRFIMKSKLSVLEKLINEEEKFLSGDVFCESGFYESVETAGEL